MLYSKPTIKTEAIMIFECIEKRYAVEIDVKAFSIIDGIKYGHYLDDREKPSLFDDLSKFPELHNVDYNGHFGSYIYFTIWTGDDNEKLHKKIQACIEKHVQRALKWAERQ